MRTHSSIPGRAVLVLVFLLAVSASNRAQQGGNLSGVVLPDLPPEVSPGEEISFTPPAGSEGGTWTLSGVVAEEELPEEPPVPAAARVALKPSPGMPAISEAQQVALALAAAIEQEPWASCASGRPIAANAAQAAGDPLPGIDVAIEKGPVRHAVRMVVSELSPEQVSSLKASRPANTHQNQQERYFGAQLESLDDGGKPAYKSYFESRSNTARAAKLPDSTLYSLLRRGGSKRPVEVTAGAHLFDAAIPPVVVALAGDPKNVSLMPVQCALPPVEPPLPAPVKIGLKLPEGGEPWTDEHLVGLAVAAAIKDGSWEQCASAEKSIAPPPPAPGDGIGGVELGIRKSRGGQMIAPPPPAPGDGIGGVEVGLRKKPGGGSHLAFRVLVSEQSGEAAAPLQEAAAEVKREAVGTEFAVRYFGVDTADPACSTCKSFFESRSNTANKLVDTADYSVTFPGISLTEVEVSGMQSGGDAPPPSMVIATAISRPSSKRRGRNPPPQASVVLAAAQCVEPAARSFWPKPEKPSKPNLRAVPRLVFKVAETLKPGEPFSVIYKDPSGKTLLNVPAAPGVEVVPPRPVNPTPSLDAAPEYAIAGRPVCACGNFPDARSRDGFLFDEQAISALSASSHMAILPLAATVRPGRHPISGSPDAGFSAKDVVFTTVINVNGKLDANQLKRGQSTQMELTIVGTDKPVGLRVVNNTPGNISIGGRTDQVLTTTGGSNNHVVQKVDSIAPGNFSIDFSLAGDRCPCQGK